MNATNESNSLAGIKRLAEVIDIQIEVNRLTNGRIDLLYEAIKIIKEELEEINRRLKNAERSKFVPRDI